MIVRLTQIDGKLPNLALVRLAAVHRRRGHDVRFTRSPYQQLLEPAYDIVYGSAIFSFSADRVGRLRAEFPGAVVGGTWNPDDAPWPDLYCLGTTSKRSPKHPLARGHHRVPRGQQPILWRVSDA